MTALTVDQARQMGRDLEKLSIDSGARTVSVRRNYLIRGATVVQVAVDDEVVARIDIVVPERPSFTGDRITHLSGTIFAAPVESDLIAAWFEGCYGDVTTTRSTTWTSR